MPRLFTALEVPADVAAQLALHRGGLPGARWVEASDHHLTLRFLGDLDNPTADDVHAMLEAMRPRAPITVTLDALASFGGDRPRAVYAAVSANPALGDLQAEHERIARRAGIEPEKRKFTPHVTLARLRGTPPDAVARYMTQTGIFSRIVFIAHRFALFSARESRGGGPYVMEATYPFDAAPETDRPQRAPP